MIEVIMTVGVSAAFIAVVVIFVFAFCQHTTSPGFLLIVTGKVKKNEDGSRPKYIVSEKEKVFVVPFVQRATNLDVRPKSCVIEAAEKNYKIEYQVYSEGEGLDRAVENLLGAQDADLMNLFTEVLEECLEKYPGDYEEIYKKELDEVGIRLDSVRQIA